MKKVEKESTLPDYDYLKPASTQDCTGLIPAGIVDEAEIENYEDLYPFLPSTLSYKKDQSKI